MSKLRDELLADVGPRYIEVATDKGGAPIYMEEPTIAGLMELHLKLDTAKIEDLVPAYAIKYIKQKTDDGRYVPVFAEADYATLKKVRANSALGAVMQALTNHILILTGQIVPSKLKAENKSKKK